MDLSCVSDSNACSNACLVNKFYKFVKLRSFYFVCWWLVWLHCPLQQHQEDGHSNEGSSRCRNADKLIIKVAVWCVYLTYQLQFLRSIKCCLGVAECDGFRSAAWRSRALLHVVQVNHWWWSHCRCASHCHRPVLTRRPARSHTRARLQHPGPLSGAC